MNIVFAGTPEFAVASLRALLEQGHTICAIYTKPDRPFGRGQKVAKNPVKAFAHTHPLAKQIPIYQPETLKDPQVQKQLADLKPDLMVVVAYGLILPKGVLDLPRFGCINVHASLLPRWRGAAPIQHAILSGDAQTGITIMQMDVGLDTGDMLYQASCSIEKKDTAQTLHDRLAELGAVSLIKALEGLFAGRLTALPQEEQAATYAHKIHKENGRMDWSQPAVHLERKIRAFNPWPVAHTYLGETVIRIWQGSVLNQIEPNVLPGTILQTSHQGVDVATGHQAIRLSQLQLPGGKILSVRDILNAHPALFKTGLRLV